MIPTFSNMFTVTKNANNSEVVIDFRHVYPESVVDTEGKVVTVQKNSSVFSTVMTYENAKALRDLLNKIIE